MNVVRYHDEVYAFDGRHHRLLSQSDLQHLGYAFLSESFATIDKGVEPYKASTARVNELTQALKANCHLLLEERDNPPFWLDDSKKDASHLIPFRNGILNLESGDLMAHQPELFCDYLINRDHQPDAQCPLFFKFLEEVLDGDEESIRLISMYGGYALTPWTHHQKALFMIGAPRSGKSTMADIFGLATGKQNFTSTSLYHLASEFGLQNLLGKRLAVIPDAHLVGRQSNTTLVLERLKSIIGEDAQIVNRKHLDPMSVKLNCKFVLVGNKIDDFPDTSGALAARMLFLNFKNSFLGKEDKDLRSKLTKELPGITNFFLEGLKLLKKEGKFSTPGASAELAQQFRDTTSPVRTFLDECCILGEGEVVVSDLFARWRSWAEQNNHEIGSAQQFGAKLRAEEPALSLYKPSIDGTQKRCYKGIQLLVEEAEDEDFQDGLL